MYIHIYLYLTQQKIYANFSILAFLVISTLYKEGGPVGMSDVTEYFKKVSAKGRNHITHPLRNVKFHQLKFSGIQTGFGFDSDKQAYFEVDQVIVL